MKETNVQQLVRLRLSRIAGLKIFRNNVGKLFDKFNRLVTFGLSPGSGDLIGWHSITITPEHVGKKIAQFVSLEVKTETGKVRPDQEHWRQVVAEAGGIAGIVRSPEDAENLFL